jgi:hypothetical protein
MLMNIRRSESAGYGVFPLQDDVGEMAKKETGGGGWPPPVIDMADGPGCLPETLDRLTISPL